MSTRYYALLSLVLMGVAGLFFALEAEWAAWFIFGSAYTYLLLIALGETHEDDPRPKGAPDGPV